MELKTYILPAVLINPFTTFSHQLDQDTFMNNVKLRELDLAENRIQGEVISATFEYAPDLEKVLLTGMWIWKLKFTILANQPTISLAYNKRLYWFCMNGLWLKNWLSIFWQVQVTNYSKHTLKVNVTSVKVQYCVYWEVKALKNISLKLRVELNNNVEVLTFSKESQTSGETLSIIQTLQLKLMFGDLIYHTDNYP